MSDGAFVHLRERVERTPDGETLWDLVIGMPPTGVGDRRTIILHERAPALRARLGRLVRKGLAGARLVVVARDEPFLGTVHDLLPVGLGTIGRNGIKPLGVVCGTVGQVLSLLDGAVRDPAGRGKMAPPPVARAPVRRAS